MKHRTVVRRVSIPAEQGASAVLQRAIERLRETLQADVVFASTVSAGGVLNCLAVAPVDRARFAPVSLGRFPQRTAVLDEARLTLFARSYDRPEGSSVVSVPVRTDGGLRAIVTIVMAEEPDSRCLLMLDDWAELLAECISGANLRQELVLRSAAIGRLQEVMDSALGVTSDAVVAIDLDGRVIRWNGGSERLYGWSADEVLGTVLPMVAPARRVTAVSRLREIASTGTVTQTPGMVHCTADGRTITIHATMLPLFDEEGHVYGAVAIMTDESLSASRQMDTTPPTLSEAALARLAAPVTAVSGFVQLLRRGDALSDPVVRDNALRGLERRCREITDISEELRLATRLLEPDPQLRLQAEDPCRTLNIALERARGIGSGRIAVEATEGLTMHVDPECLEGAVTSLLRALLRCHSEDSTVRATAHAEEDGVALVFSAGPAKTPGVVNHPESGLGIHLARLCAQVHGGQFGVSAERETTEVRLLMPVGAAVD